MSAAQFLFTRAVLTQYTRAETAYRAALAAYTPDLPPADRDIAGRRLDEACADLVSLQQGLRQAQTMAGA
jgi:hypothetical protein